MQAAAVSVNGVDLPLLHPLWLTAVQSLLPTVKVNAPKKTDRQDRAALALLAFTGVMIFAALSLLEWTLLRRWHESALGEAT